MGREDCVQLLLPIIRLAGKNANNHILRLAFLFREGQNGILELVPNKHENIVTVFFRYRKDGGGISRAASPT